MPLSQCSGRGHAAAVALQQLAEKRKEKKRWKRKGRETMRRMKRKGGILMVVKLDLLSTERRKKKGHTIQREWEKER